MWRRWEERSVCDLLYLLLQLKLLGGVDGGGEGEGGG